MPFRSRAYLPAGTPWVPGMPIRRERRPLIVPKPVPVVPREPLEAPKPNARQEPQPTEAVKPPSPVRPDLPRANGRPAGECSVNDVVAVFESHPGQSYRSGELAVMLMATTGVGSRTAADRWIARAKEQGRIIKKNHRWSLK